MGDLVSERRVMTCLHKGIVHPWLCDVMGHLATRYYMAAFDEAAFQLLSEFTGWAPQSISWKTRGWADVRQEINYYHEMVAGTLFRIDGTVQDITKSSIVALFEMHDLGHAHVAARLSSKMVHFDLVARKAIAITGELREMISTRMGAVSPSV